ncbi:multicopper oxidase family protein [Salipiger mucosus]|nr:multicopper oxidase domain-containing protein [Salipiger mucosus]
MAQDIASPPRAAALARTSMPERMVFPAPEAPRGMNARPEALIETDDCLGADVCYDLSLRYVDGQLRNPAFPADDPGGFDDVRLRAYGGLVLDDQGSPVAQDNPFVAPVVEIAPGDTFRLTFENELPRPRDMVLPGEAPGGGSLSCIGEPADHNAPHCSNFNLTNIHTHGLWVSPLGNSDNVLLTVNPGIRFTYEYNIPNDHPAGTFWYHAHRHGSTAPQVSSGMAGILLIRGNRQPVLGAAGWALPGDLDVILPRPEVGGHDLTFPERTMLFQQIAYACRWSRDQVAALEASGTPRDELPVVGSIKTDTETGAWICDEGDVGMVEPGPVNAFDQLTPTAWPASGRYTAINGGIQQEQPGAVAGRVERWRLIHGGVRETIGVQIRKVETRPVDALRTRLSEGSEGRDRADETVEEFCSGAPVELVRVATDGLTRPDIRTGSEVILQPAYREDVLVSFPSEGTYCIVDAESAAQADINVNDNDSAILGFIDVAPAEVQLEGGSGADHVLAILAQSIEATIEDGAARDVILDDLSAGRLDAFVKHRDISDSEVSGGQTVGFALNLKPGGVAFEIGNFVPTHVSNGAPFALVDEAAYEASRIDRVLPLRGVDEWTLSSFGSIAVGHPFHIHVNPFQIVEVLKYRPDPGCTSGTGGTPSEGAQGCSIDPNDPSTYIDVSVPDSIEPQYAGFKDTWKDTLFVLPGYLVKMRTRYERYIGDFVMHCHILDHEDQGMMQNIRIALPDGKGGFDGSMTRHIAQDGD